jgi:hypothetical protein
VCDLGGLTLSAALSIEDLFAAGIGLDIGGACLVALGLMTSPRHIVDVIDLWRGGNAFLGLALVDDKINGESGVVFLVAGFSLQAMAYVLTAALQPNKAEGAWGTIGVVVCLALGLLATLIGARLWRKARRRPLIVETAHFDQIPRVRMDLPIEGRLMSFLDALGEETFIDWFQTHRDEYEGRGFEAQYEFYCSRFGIDDFFLGDDPFWKASEARRASAIPSPGLRQYTAAADGLPIEGKAGMLHRIFG